VIAFIFNVVFGVVEDFTKIMAALLLFRFDFRKFWLPILITSLVISLSDTLVIDDLKLPFIVSESIDVVILLISLIYLLRLSFWFSMILSLSSWVYGFLMQCIGYAGLVHYSVFEPKDFYDHYQAVCTLQAIGGVLCVLVSTSIYQKGWGFLFMQERIRIQERLNLLALVGVVICVALMEYTIYLVYTQNRSNLAPMSACLFLFSLVLLTIYIKVNRDWEQYYSTRNAKDFNL
jgi:hypothetical protein